VPWEIRDATETDIDRVGEIHYAARFWAYRSFLSEEALRLMDAGKMAAWWRERIAYEVPPCRLRLAGQSPATAGFCYSGPSDWPEPDTGMVFALHVDPPIHRRGIGAALMGDALTTMRANGWSQARLWVLADNVAARRFYQRHGWTETGDDREDYVGPTPTTQLRYGISLADAAAKQ
jgi:ribosomal protein S18 acetylase RimI-like enzyme